MFFIPYFIGAAITYSLFPTKAMQRNPNDIIKYCSIWPAWWGMFIACYVAEKIEDTLS